MKGKNKCEIVSTPNSTPNATSLFTELETLKKMSLREQILTLMKENPSISKKKMSEVLDVSMYALKKEIVAMSKENIAEFVGFSRNGKWVVH